MIPGGHPVLAAAAVLLAVLLAYPDAGARLRRLLGGQPGGRPRTPGGLDRPGVVTGGAGGRGGVRRLAAGRRASAAGTEVDEALVLDLVASALAAGTPPEGALAVVGGAVGGARGAALERVAARLRLGSDWSSAWQDDGHASVAGRSTARASQSADSPSAGQSARREQPGADIAALRRALGLAVATGAPASGLLAETAADVRRRRHRQAQAAAARLGVRMVLPLGLCSLPAFVAWAVLPVVLSLAGQLLGG